MQSIKLFYKVENFDALNLVRINWIRTLGGLYEILPFNRIFVFDHWNERFKNYFIQNKYKYGLSCSFESVK